MFNSGLEVWLYDEANREAIRQSGGLQFGAPGSDHQFNDITRAGLLVGYSLYQDDGLDVSVIVGDPLTPKELRVARWLEPQSALLKLPSGALCVESNDASRIGPEDPTDEGGRVSVLPGDYRCTLYRIDYEALRREGLPWTGPQEVLVLTPGGTAADAAEGLLPFAPVRDTSWMGRYIISGNRAEGLVWFGDYWDTFVVNLDRRAAAQWGLSPGRYLKVHVPAANIALVTVFAASWPEGQRLPPPEGMKLVEYGYAAFSPLADWNGAEALFGRRDKTKTRIEDALHKTWLPATIELLDVAPAAPRTAAGPSAASNRAYSYRDLREQPYFDSGFLALVLSDVLAGAGNADELELDAAVDLLDDAMKALGLEAEGDFGYDQTVPDHPIEYSCRVYAGLPDAFGLVRATDGAIDVVFISERVNGGWLVTGLADGFSAQFTSGGPPPGLQLQTLDDALPTLLAAHRKTLGSSGATGAPEGLEAALGAFERLAAAAFD